MMSERNEESAPVGAIVIRLWLTQRVRERSLEKIEIKIEC
jgi:hypothetical protein